MGRVRQTDVEPLWHTDTTNNIEGWQSNLKQMTEHFHPNVFTAIQMFKLRTGANDIEIIQRAVDRITRSRAKRYETTGRKLNILKERY